MSIVRVGLAETKKFAEGYDAIFVKKKVKPKKRPSSVKASTAKKRSLLKKKK